MAIGNAFFNDYNDGSNMPFAKNWTTKIYIIGKNFINTYVEV